MKDNIKFIGVDRVFSKLSREIGDDFVEDDVIEWIGEALEFLKVPQILSEEIKFLEVKDYEVYLPTNLHAITQLAKKNTDVKPGSIFPAFKAEPIENFIDIDLSNSSTECEDCDELLSMENLEDVFLETEQVSLPITYDIWTNSELYQDSYSPIRLSTNNFFGGVVCEEIDKSSIYKSCVDEYTIIGDVVKKLRFSFKEGLVAMSFLKNSVDKETGYPLIPDQISYLTAINYYVKWKIAEKNMWAGREGWVGLSDKAEAKWLRYVKQAKSHMKMPKTLDQFQNLLDQTHYLIPDHKKYYGFFGNLNQREERNFNRLNRGRNLNIRH